MIRVTYMGTPEYAVPALMALAASDEVEIGLVVTQPDRPQGRGRSMQSPPVKTAADNLELPVLQASTLKSSDARDRLVASRPDVIVVAAFGLILGPKTLSLPHRGCINLHASLLPKYRGANPIAAAIAAEEAETGVTLMHMDRGLDTGDIIATRTATIDRSATTASLTVRLADVGAALLMEMLPSIAAGSAPRSPQPAGASLTRPMVKDDGCIDWTRSATQVDAHVRAMIPWPGAWTTTEDGIRLLARDVSIEEQPASLSPGFISVRKREILVGTSGKPVRLVSAQLPGGRELKGQSLVDRIRPLDGTVLGPPSGFGAPGPLTIPAPNDDTE